MQLERKQLQLSLDAYPVSGKKGRSTHSNQGSMYCCQGWGCLLTALVIMGDLPRTELQLCTKCFGA